MNLQHRIDLLVQLGQYILSDNENWLAAKEKASYENGWFTEEFVASATQNIANEFLQKESLESWAKKYPIESNTNNPKKIVIIIILVFMMIGKVLIFIKCFD